MQIIDAQLHDPAPWLDWSSADPDVRDRLLTELTRAWLDALGITGAVVFSGHGGWADEAARTMPERFSSVPHVHPDQPDVEVFVQEIKETPGIVGLRAVIGYPPTGEEATRAEAGEWDATFEACANNRVPLFMFATRFLPIAARVARDFPTLTLIVDHIGLPQPPMDQREDPPFRALPEVLELAQFENVAIKLCGLPALSSERFPYRDVNSRLRQLVDAFGADRLMWASDIPRFNGRIGLEFRIPGTEGGYLGKHNYAESLHFIRENEELTDTEKQWILGGTVQKWLGWPEP